MSSQATLPKDPAKVAAGRAGARRRWGNEPRVIRLDGLSPGQRRLVLALIEAAKQQGTAAEGKPAAVIALEGQTDDRSAP